jgi:hypothetical protein
MSCIVYYVSGHGLGHAARSVGVCRKIPPEIDLVIRTPSPEWFWRAELERPFRWEPAEFDCGAIQTDSLAVDAAATLARYAELAAENAARKEDEKRFLRACGATLVVGDIPPFPFEVAGELGIPSVFVGNFTWTGIYLPYLEAAPESSRMDYREMLATMAAQYCGVGRAFHAPLSIPMPEFLSERVARINHIRRPFRDMRAALHERFRIPPGGKLALIAIGQWGMDLAWERLGDFPDVSFVGLNMPPAARAHVIDVPYPEFRSQDLAASVDVVVAKAGYGTIVECMAAGVPLVYPPREGFCEQPALEAGLGAWGNAIKVSRDDFYGLNLRGAFDRVLALPRKPVSPMDGGETVAAALADSARQSPGG